MRRLPLILLLVATAGAACTVPKRKPAHERRVAGHSREGRPIGVHVLGRGERTVLFLASIHGDEPAGTLLLERFAAWLLAEPERLRGVRVVIVPVANPDAVAAGTRTNAAGVDVNRNFPTRNFRPSRRHGAGPLSEPETRALHRIVTEFDPEVVVPIHQPMALVDWDGPAEDLAKAMGGASGLPVRKLGGRPGSMGSWVGIDLGKPIVTLELPPGAGRLGGEGLWEACGGALVVALRGFDVEKPHPTP